MLIQPSFLYPLKSPLLNENSLLSVADFSLVHSGGAMETGISHPPLIESSLGGAGNQEK